MPIWLVEDSEVMNSGYSLILDRLRGSCDATIVYWRSPGWELLDSIQNPVLLDSPSYLYSGIKASTGDDIQKKYALSYSVHPRDTIFSVNDWLKQCTKHSDQIDLRKLCTCRYMGLELGKAIVSSCLRILPYSNATLQAPYQLIADLAFKLFRSLEFFDNNQHFLARLDCVFFSESVYQSSVLIDYFLRAGLSCPFLYASDGPLVLTKFHLGERIGISPRIAASRQLHATHGNLLNTSSKQWLRRVSGRKSVLSLDPIQHSIMNEWGMKLAETLNINYYLNDHSLMQDSIDYTGGVFVFYLHAITDGAYLHGFSGYVTPYEFYSNIINTLIRTIKSSSSYSPLVVLRIHPNLCNGSQSSYTSHRIRASSELEVGIKLINNLVNICRKINVTCHLCSASVKNKYILAIPNVIVVSHHGSIAGEAASLNVPVLSSRISHLVDQSDSENVYIWSEGQENSVIRKCMRNIGVPNHILLSKKRIQFALAADRYNASPLESAIHRLNDLAHKLNFPCFDEMIYKESFSWNYDKLSSTIPRAFDIMDVYINSIDVDSLRRHTSTLEVDHDKLNVLDNVYFQ